MKRKERLTKFLQISKSQPLRALDLFGGVGAFSHGLSQGSGCIKVTHAVEISPSATRTFKFVLFHFIR